MGKNTSVLKKIPYRNIPNALFHYTSVDNFKSIIQSNNEDGKEICFWAFSNRYKNDECELKYGKKIHEMVCTELKDKNKLEYLDKPKDECYLLSFSKVELSFIMIERYCKGNSCIRLDFDFTDILNPQKILPCEYRYSSELDDYATMFREKYNELFELQSDFKNSNSKNLFDILNMCMEETTLKYSLKEKIYTIKEKTEWENEQEWRMILFPDESNQVYKDNNGHPYVKKYFPIKCLNSVCLFNTDKIDPSKSSYQYKEEFYAYLKQHNWEIPIVIETLTS